MNKHVNKKDTRQKEKNGPQPRGSNAPRANGTSKKISKEIVVRPDVHKCRAKAAAYLLALAILNPTAFSGDGGKKLMDLINPAYYGFGAKKYRYGELNAEFHTPASGEPGYGRCFRQAGVGENEFFLTCADPTQTDLNASNDLAFIGHYVGQGVNSNFPNFPIPDAKSGEIYPFIIKNISSKKDMFPTKLVNDPVESFTPLQTFSRAAGTAVSFDYAVELNRPSTNAWALQFRGLSATGVVAWTLTLTIGANQQLVNGTANVTVVNDAITTDRVELVVSVSPSADVAPTKVLAVKTTATNSGTPAFNITAVIPALFESNQYLITWMQGFDSPAYTAILKNKWQSLNYVTIAGHSTGTNLATSFYKGGKQKHGRVFSPFEMNVPYANYSNITTRPEMCLSKGFNGTLVPSWNALTFGADVPMAERQNFLVVYQAPTGASSYQSIVIGCPYIYMLATLNPDIGASPNVGCRLVYDYFLKFVGQTGFYMTYNDDHLNAFRRLVRSGKAWYKKHSDVIDPVVSGLGEALKTGLKFAIDLA